SIGGVERQGTARVSLAPSGALAKSIRFACQRQNVGGLVAGRVEDIHVLCTVVALDASAATIRTPSVVARAEAGRLAWRPAGDGNDNGRFDPGETFIDVNGNGKFDAGDGATRDRLVWAEYRIVWSGEADLSRTPHGSQFAVTGRTAGGATGKLLLNDANFNAL